LPVAAAAAAVIGFGFEIGTVIWVTLLQELVPARLLGRVRSLDFLVSFALMPVSYAITAPVASAIGLTPTIVGASIAASVVTFGFMLWPDVLAPDRPGFVPDPG
ncbi:MAG: hypothetical protein ACRDJM_11275, partial [Actinomycetota bacterium]